MDPLLAYAGSRRDALLDFLLALVRAESPSTDKMAVDRCGAVLEQRLRELGASVERLAVPDRGDHVRAAFEGTGPAVLLLGHFDTVWPAGQIERMPIREEQGRLYGPGVYDMKGGIAAALLAIEALRALGERMPATVMLFTTDEEIGSGTSRPFIEEEARRSRAVLVLEPCLPGGAAKTSRKGCGDFELIVHGVSSHAGLAPGQGANAVHELARLITAVEGLQDAARGVGVNVTVVAGGERTNVIPDLARAMVDVRVPTASDARRIEERLRSLSVTTPGTSLEVRGAVARPPLERTPANVALYELARSCARDLGRELGEGAAGGGSDGNFTGALGVSTLDGLGPDGDGAHALHEHILIEELPWRAALLARLLSRLPDWQTR